MNACNSDDHGILILSATIDDPNAPDDEDPTFSWPAQEIDPTEGCPGIEDVCVYGPNDPNPKDLWVCEGSASSRFDYQNGATPDEFAFSSPSLDPFDGQIAEVLACCSDDYLEGCENSSNIVPQALSCIKDCAFQLCRKFVVDFKADVVDQMVMLGPDPDLSEAMDMLAYLDQNSKECQQALLARTDCEELAGLGSPWCNSGFRFQGRWNFSTIDFPTFDDFVFEGQCEVTDFYEIPDSTSPGFDVACDGVQINNADPFPETSPGIDTMHSFEVVSLSGALNATVGEVLIAEDVEISDVQFRKQIACGSTVPCAFRLEQMRLDVAEIDLGDLSLVDVQGALFVTAAGTHTGNEATLPASTLQIFVMGSVESSTYPIVDGLPFAWIVHNPEPVSLYITESPTAALPLFGIPSALLSLGMTLDTSGGAYEFTLDVDEGVYNFAP